MKSLPKLAFFQALGLATYCSLIGLLMSYGDTIFGKAPNYFGPLLALLLMCTSALICGLIALYNPIILIFKKKKPILALRLITYTVLWLILFITLILIGNCIF
jgi:hypothetical protein